MNAAQLLPLDILKNGKKSYSAAFVCARRPPSAVAWHRGESGWGIRVGPGMDGMKRGQMDEADKHAVRRKIEEKHVMIREQRKASFLAPHLRMRT